ncbi:ATP-binding protein [Nocardia sp. CNY236]|uniref:ATP-binding protein n=1 Tax=Nocardia sp. CNY236 TaxID=1169152 RepID=UPI0003F99C4E|nr:ATP-binding protein [Nocardia sp. CNY236]
MAIPANPTSTIVDTDIAPQEAVTMTSRVDEDGARRIMGMLVDMYADPVTAVVREYVANAVDATIAAGSMLPVEVTTPDALTPNLVVVDRGTGMTSAEVEAVFLAFAASTKRGTNEQVGGLGVGAKSAWTVADSFLIDTVKAGRRTVVRAARDLAHHVLVADAATDRPPGTSITIPVDEQSAPKWRDVVRSVTAAHKPGAVIVDGEPVISIQGGPRWVGPIRCGHLDSKEARGKAKVTVLSGGTLFSVPRDIEATVTRRVDMGCVVELPVGTFDHTPSRESLIATPRTQESIAQALREFDQQWTALGERIAALVETDVMAAQTLRAATLDSHGNQSHLPIDATMTLTSDILTFGPSHSWRMAWTPGTPADTVPMSAFGQWCERLLIITGWPNRRSLRGVAKYARIFAPHVTSILALRGEAKSVALPVKNSVQAIQITVDTPGVTIVSYTEMQRQLEERRSADRPARRDPAYRVVRRKDGKTRTVEMTLSQISALSVPVVYAARVEWCEFPCGLEDGALVYLGRKSPNTFTAAVTHAVEYTQWANQRVHDLIAAGSELDLDAVALDSVVDHRWLFELAYSVADYVPEAHPAAETLRRMKAIHAHALSSRGAAQWPLARAMEQCSRAEFFAPASIRVADLAKTLKEMYPLFNFIQPSRLGRGSNVAHIGEYLANVAPKTTATVARAAE